MSKEVEESVENLKELMRTPIEDIFLIPMHSIKILLNELDRLQKLADTDLYTVYLKGFEDGKDKSKEELGILIKDNKDKDQQIKTQQYLLKEYRKYVPDLAKDDILIKDCACGETHSFKIAKKEE